MSCPLKLHKSFANISIDCTSLSDEFAESLSRGHKGCIELNGLLELSDNAAASLSRNDGSLELNALVQLSEVAAAHLSKMKRALCLNGLRNLSDQAAESLAKHPGPLSINLDAIPESASAILRTHPSFEEQQEF